MELILAVILFFIVSVFVNKVKRSRNGGGRVEKIEMRLSSDRQYMEPNQLIKVSCPYCRRSLFVSGQGSWICEKCEEVLIYYKNNTYKRQEIHSLTAIQIVTILAEFCKADGVVTKSELQIVEKNLKNFLDINGREMNGLKKIFNAEMRNVDSYEQILKSLYESLEDEEQLRQQVGIFLIEVMFDIATSSKPGESIDEGHNEIIFKTVGIFNMSLKQYETIKNRHITQLDVYYELLECDKNATEKEIKKKYRELSKKYHPDMYCSEDLPPEIIELTSDKFRKINEAYNILMKELSH